MYSITAPANGNDFYTPICPTKNRCNSWIPKIGTYTNCLDNAVQAYFISILLVQIDKDIPFQQHVNG